MEEKVKKLAQILVDYSIDVKEKEKVFISYGDIACTDLVFYLVEEIKKKKAFAFSQLENRSIDTLQKKNLTTFDISCLKELEEAKMDFFDSVIYIRYASNDYELKDMDPKKKKELSLALEDSLNIRVNKRKWVLLNYPSPLDAHKAKKSYVEFKDYAFSAMVADYKKMAKDLLPLKKLMEKTDKVRIKAKGTDLTFSIKNMPVIICAGEKNIPDGEVYTAPVKDSVNGTITYNTPSPYQGEVYHHVCLTFKDGKIINATSDENSDSLKAIFDSDEGARYIGEFSLGVNPMIMNPMGDILYDEKIYGSLHFTPGCAYDDCNNGNKSIIHWDLVLIQTKDFSGGELYFDDVLIRKDGEFVLPSLKELNK